MCGFFLNSIYILSGVPTYVSELIFWCETMKMLGNRLASMNMDQNIFILCVFFLIYVITLLKEMCVDLQWTALSLPFL